jgi:hypothetical protein
MARVDMVMDNATYNRRHPNQAGGRAHTVQSTVDFAQLGSGAAAVAMWWQRTA